MRQIVPPQWKKRIRNFFLDLDARIDSTLFSSGKGLRELYERYSTFMDRFYVGRWKRWVFIEPLSEAATIGLGGLILMLALAVPAFRETPGSPAPASGSARRGRWSRLPTTAR